MESWLFLDVVVRKGSAILKLLSGEYESLLVWWNTFLVLDFGFDILDGIGGLDVQSDGLSSEGLDKNLHTTSESEDQVKSRFLLDVVVRESSTIFKLLSGENESLLIWWDSFLVLNLGLDVFDWVCWLNIKGDGLSGQSLDEDLHSTTESENKMESGFFLDVVVGESSAILELLSGKNESLLVWRDAFFVLDLGFDILDWVSWLDIKGDGLTSESLDKDLHATSKSEDKVQGWLFLDIVITESSTVLQLLSCEDESLLVWRDSFLVLDFGLDILDGVCWLDIKGDGLSGECFDEDLHFWW